MTTIKDIVPAGERFTRPDKAGHDVAARGAAPAGRGLRRSTTGQVRAADSCQVAPDLLASLIITGAQATASNVAEAQCEEGDITAALNAGLGDTVAKLLQGDSGHVWAGLYFRTFTVTLHKLEYATALDHISLSALLAFLTLRLGCDSSIPAGRWQEFQENVFGHPRAASTSESGAQDTRNA